MKVSKFLATFVVALGLYGCGGGGGGSTPASTSTPTPPPTATLAAMAPAAGSADVAVDAKLVFTLAVTGATTSDASKLAFLCNSKATPFAVSSVVAGAVSTNTLTPTAALTNGDSCTVSGDVTTTGAGGSVKTPVVSSFTVVALPAWWPPKVIAQIPVGSTVTAGVVGANQLPAGCHHAADKCFHDAVADGTVKAVASGGVDSTGRSTTFLYFKNANLTGLCAATNGCWAVLSFNTADGALTASDIDSGSYDELYEVWGSSKGVIYRGKINSVDICFELAYDKVYNSWDINGTGISDPVPCPKP